MARTRTAHGTTAGCTKGGIRLIALTISADDEQDRPAARWSEAPAAKPPRSRAGPALTVPRSTPKGRVQVSATPWVICSVGSVTDDAGTPLHPRPAEQLVAPQALLRLRVLIGAPRIFDNILPYMTVCCL